MTEVLPLSKRMSSNSSRKSVDAKPQMSINVHTIARQVGSLAGQVAASSIVVMAIMASEHEAVLVASGFEACDVLSQRGELKVVISVQDIVGVVGVLFGGCNSVLAPVRYVGVGSMMRADMRGRCCFHRSRT